MAFNFDRTEASDPISIDDRILATMREQGGNPGLAKLPGAPMIVANPLYPDEAASAPLPPQRPASAEQSGGRGGRAPTPPKRPVEAGGEGENGGFSGGAKYAGLTQPGGTQAPTPPPRPPEQGGTPQGSPEGTGVNGTAVAGGAAGLLALLALRALRSKGQQGAVELPPEAGGPAQPKALPAPQDRLALPAPEEQKLLPKPETIYAGDESGSPKQIEHISNPEPEGELIKPEEFKKPAQTATAEEVPAGEEKAPPKPKRSRSSKKAVGDEKVTLPNSGAEIGKSDLNEALSKLLGIGDQVEGLVRGGGTKPRAKLPKIGR